MKVFTKLLFFFRFYLVNELYLTSKSICKLIYIKLKIIFSFWLFSLFSLWGCGSTDHTESVSQKSSLRHFNKKEVLVGFYNVENLFDIHDEPEKEDQDFLPEGRYKWITEKYLKKQDNLAEAILSMGNNGPDILGIAEIENALVLRDLVQMTKLKQRKYEIVHEESMDMRELMLD